MMQLSNVFQRSLHVDSLEAVRAEGKYIYTNDGQKLLDASCGAAVSSIGHGNKRIIACVHEQLSTLDYVFFNTFATPVSAKNFQTIVNIIISIIRRFSQLKN